MTHLEKTPDSSIERRETPFALFKAWFERAQQTEPSLPDAMSLATVDAGGMPNSRLVLLKDITRDGLVFYTNIESQKGVELAQNPKAALCFHWKSLGRQVRVQGITELVSDEEADAYFANRPKDSQIGAWASAQSRVLEGRFALEAEVARYAAKYALRKVDRPAFWSGYRLRPLRFEFWQERKFRLHDRLVYRRDSVTQKDWVTEHLFP